jgi:hypothetical protein
MLPSKKTVEGLDNISRPATRTLAGRQGLEALKRLYPAQECDRSVFSTRLGWPSAYGRNLARLNASVEAWRQVGNHRRSTERMSSLRLASNVRLVACKRSTSHKSDAAGGVPTSPCRTSSPLPRSRRAMGATGSRRSASHSCQVTPTIPLSPCSRLQHLQRFNAI